MHKFHAEPAMRPTTVLLADDHDIVTEELRRRLTDAFDLVGSVGNGLVLLREAVRLNPDVIVADLAMPGLGALDLLHELAVRDSESRVIVLATHEDPRPALDAFRLGAWGYVLEEAAVAELITAIRDVDAGHTFVTPHVRKAMASAAKGATTRSDAGALRPRRILVADDYEPGATAIAGLLRRSGHVVTTALEAAEVLDAAIAFRPDLVFLDLGFHGRSDGIAVALQLREEPSLTGTVLVALTGRSLDKDDPWLAAGRFDGYVEKPADAAALDRMIALAPAHGIEAP
jgi:DNA-binding NarL/FixJ family response regulator